MRYIPGRIPVILAVSNLFFTCAVSVDLTIATLVGYQLAPSAQLATVPFALITVAGAFSSLFAAGMIGRETKNSRLFWAPYAVPRADYCLFSLC